MRRTLLLLAAFVTLGVAFTAPATAAPYPHPEAATWEITCPGMGHFAVMSPSLIPGWRLERGPPVLYFGGEATVYVNVPVDSFSSQPPPGLSGRLSECTMVGPLEDLDAFRVEWDLAYFLFLGD